MDDLHPGQYDLPADPLERLLAEVRAERVRQDEVHGDQSCASPTIGNETKLVILVEEVGEVANAMTYDEGGDPAHLREELLQVATVALGWASSL